jgi:hypothetical protein
VLARGQGLKENESGDEGTLMIQIKVLNSIMRLGFVLVVVVVRMNAQNAAGEARAEKVTATHTAPVLEPKAIEPAPYSEDSRPAVGRQQRGC